MNRLIILYPFLLTQVFYCVSYGQNLTDTLTLTLQSEESRVILNGKVTVTYHWMKELNMWSTLSFTGIEGVAEEPSESYQNNELSITRGKVFYLKVRADTIYRVTVVHEYSKVVTMEFFGLYKTRQTESSKIYSSKSFSLAQENNWKEGNSYDNAKVLLTSGEVIKTKSLSVFSSEIKVFTKGLSKAKIFSLNDVKQIEVPTENKMLLGALLGTGAGIVAMLLVQSSYEEPKTTYESGPGWSSTNIVTKFMPDEEKLLIVLGGTVLGALVGSTIKSGWKNIYPDDNLSFNLSFQKNRSINPVFSFNLIF